jgi:hypothetical protein
MRLHVLASLRACRTPKRVLTALRFVARTRCFQTPRGGELNIERLGAPPGSAYIDGVTVAWVAKHPSGGLRLIGWYVGARVFRRYHEVPETANRTVGRHRAFYLAVARTTDSVILDVDQRTLRIPRNQRGAMGQSNGWFADSQVGRNTIVKVHQFISEFGRGTFSRRPPQPVDVEQKAKVERAAIRLVSKHFARQGYRVMSVESANLGWDLTATRGLDRLQIEVKGLSGKGAVVELTPNEYANMLGHHKTYRLCVVRNALDRHHQTLHKFSCLGDGTTWIDQDDHVLHIEPQKGARLRWE